ncbi:hypothetical protein OIY81_2328 [Cryptosporidium canis]|nr:hypothetical protein OIY81_2328 [Cryptosporidium canis]
MRKHGLAEWRRLWICVSALVGAALVGESPSRAYEFTNKIIVNSSPVEELFKMRYDNESQELESLRSVIGEPWEGFEVVKVQLNSSRVGVRGETEGDGETEAGSPAGEERRMVFGKYRRLKVKYPLGSRKRLISLQNCVTGMTASINFSPMRIKTEFSIYLPFGSNIDPINHQGLTYLMGFIFLNMGSDVDNYALDFGEYIERQNDSSMTSVTVSSLYTKLSVTVSDLNALEALRRFTDSVGYESGGPRSSNPRQDRSGEIYIKSKPITTRKLLNSLCRLYYIYKSCLRDEEYRISYIKTSMRASESRKNNETDLEEPISEYFSSCGIFSTYWQEKLTSLSSNVCSMQSRIAEESLPSGVQDWLYDLKLLIREHYESYWTPENMYLYIDSALDYRLFEGSLAAKMAVFGTECEEKKGFFVGNDLVTKGIERNKERMGAIEDHRYGEIVESGPEKLEEAIKVFNIVPLSYNKSVLDIDYSIDLSNIVHAVSISLTRVMDVVTTLYLDSIMIRRLRDELGIIKDFRLTWRLHYSYLKLRMIFRFFLKTRDVYSAKRVVEDFYSYSIFLLRQFERAGKDKQARPEFRVSKELFGVVDEIQRLNEVSWQLQYLHEDLPTQLTTPINNCGVPIQVSQQQNTNPNWIKNEIRIYDPLIYKNYPQLILSSIHRSHARLPVECELAGRDGCSAFRMGSDGRISEAVSTADTGSIVFVLLEFIIRRITELRASVIFTDPYFRYRTDFVLNVKAYNHHEYVNLQFSSYYERNILFKEQDIVEFENKEAWMVPNKIVNLESSLVVPSYRQSANSTQSAERLLTPRISYRGELGITLNLDNLRFYSPIVFARSIIRTKISSCRIFGDDFCDTNNIPKRQRGLIMLSILSDIFNLSIENFWESEPIPGYGNLVSGLFHTSETRYSNWRVPGALTKPFHFGSLTIEKNEIELNFVGPSCSLLEYIRLLFEQMSLRFKPLETTEFYQNLRDFMKNEIKKRRNRTPIDYIRYYQGVLQYEDCFEDELFTNTGISITYDNYLTFHNFIIETFFGRDSRKPRQKGFMETIILGINDSQFNKAYTETVFNWVFFERPESYKKICMLQEPYFAFPVEDEPLIIRQVFTDGILTVSSASIRFQLPCNKNSSTGFSSPLSSNDLFFENEEHTWETNDNAQPRCIFNIVVSRILERIFRSYYPIVVKKLAMEISQSHNGTSLPRGPGSGPSVRGEAEPSWTASRSFPSSETPSRGSKPTSSTTRKDSPSSTSAQSRATSSNTTAPKKKSKSETSASPYLKCPNGDITITGDETHVMLFGH